MKKETLDRICTVLLCARLAVTGSILALVISVGIWAVIRGIQELL